MFKKSRLTLKPGIPQGRVHKGALSDVACPLIIYQRIDFEIWANMSRLSTNMRRPSVVMLISAFMLVTHAAATMPAPFTRVLVYSAGKILESGNDVTIAQTLLNRQAFIF